MSNRNGLNVQNRGGGGGPQVGKNHQARRHGPEKLGVRHGQSRNFNRDNLAARKDNAGKIGARPDLVILTYSERVSSTLMKLERVRRWTSNYLWPRIWNTL